MPAPLFALERIDELMFYEIMYYLTSVLGLVLFGYYYRNREKLDPVMAATGPFMWLTALSCIYEVVFTRWLFVDATAWFRIYSLLEIAALLYFFRKAVLGYRVLFWISAVVYLGSFVYMLIRFEEYDIQEADQVLSLITTLVVYAYTIAWFRQKFIHLDDESLLQSGAFYFISALLIYFSATIFLFLSAKMIYSNHKELYVQYWTFNVVMVTLTRLICIIAIWKGRKI